MFNKKKIDSKIRFQGQNFKRQLRQARGFKRTPGQNQNNQLIGKIPSILKIFVPILAAIFIYLVYLPSPFTIKKITIAGLDEKHSQKAKILMAEYFLQPSPLPQDSLLWVSKQKLESYLKKNDSDILELKTLKKRFPGELALDFAQKTPLFIISSPSDNFIIFNDTSLRAISATSSLNLPLIKINTTEELSDGSLYKNSGQLNAFQILKDKLGPLTGMQIERFDVDNSEQTLVKTYLTSGAIFIFDYTSDLPSVLEKLHLLLTSIDPKDAANLAYIDMSIKNRSYVCLKNLPCANLKPIPAENSTSTATSTLPTIK